MFLLNIYLFICFVIFNCDAANRKNLMKKSFVSLIYLNNNQNLNVNSTNSSCEWLNRLKHQSNVCWRRKGLADALLKAKNLSIAHCEEKFRFEQWNCSSRRYFLKKIYRETAFMYSLASSALVFSIARSCSEGKLAGCKCAEHGKETNSNKWQWGGCGDNIKYGKKFTKKFLQLKKFGDKPNSILRYNMETGIRVVSRNEEKICRCHGVSGSCSIKICFKKIKSFSVISEQLRGLYHTALKVQPDNNMKKNLLKGKKNILNRRLLYLEDSPNLCNSTHGRLCKNLDNCATLCCGRGFYRDFIQIKMKCNCKWHKMELFQVECEKCFKNETVFLCQ